MAGQRSASSSFALRSMTQSVAPGSGGAVRSAAFPAMGKASTIMAFGNPAVWWTGLVAILFVLGYSVYRNALPMLLVPTLSW